MERCMFTPWQLLLSRIDAEMLRHRLWHKQSHLHRSIGFEIKLIGIIGDISRFAKMYVEPDAEMRVLEAIQRLKDGLVTIGS